MRRVTLAVAFFCLNLGAARAWAQNAECKTDADCTDGFKCEVVGVMGCAGAAWSDGQEPASLPNCEEQESGLACHPPPRPAIRRSPTPVKQARNA